MENKIETMNEQKISNFTQEQVLHQTKSQIDTRNKFTVLPHFLIASKN